MDGHCDKLAMVTHRTKLTALASVDNPVEILPSPEFVTKFHKEVGTITVGDTQTPS